MQIRFWVRIDSPGVHGVEYFLCAIFPSSNEELALLERELAMERHVELEARLHGSEAPGTLPQERAPGVIFIVDRYTIAGLAPESHAAHRHPRVTGKMAAASEPPEEQLQLAPS